MSNNLDKIKLNGTDYGIKTPVDPTLSEAGIGITSVQVLDLSKCNSSVREKFRKRIQNLYKVRSYEELLTTQRDYGAQTVLVRRDGQYVNEIVIANANDVNDTMVLINGHISTENLERIINDQSNFFNR